jgi:hypothetical protein
MANRSDRSTHAPRRCRAVAALTLAALLLAVRPAHAYLDPGSGSFIYQILIASLLGAGVAIRMYWRKIKGFFARRPAREKDGPKADA